MEDKRISLDELRKDKPMEIVFHQEIVRTRTFITAPHHTDEEVEVLRQQIVAPHS